MVPRSQKRKENSGRGCGRPRVTELVGGRAELIIPITPVVLGMKGAGRRERVLVRQPQNRPVEKEMATLSSILAWEIP